jgi:hypothetical protein
MLDVLRSRVMKKAVSPARAYRWLRSLQRSFAERLLRLIGPGVQNWVARYLDQRASRRVLQAIIMKTNDVETVRWLGQPIWQYPLDAWIIQEVVGELKPDIVVETGTYLGGSAYFFACLCDLLGQGEVISIDIAARGTIPHPRITYLQGSSTDPAIVGSVAQRIPKAGAKGCLLYWILIIVRGTFDKNLNLMLLWFLVALTFMFKMDVLMSYLVSEEEALAPW